MQRALIIVAGLVVIVFGALQVTGGLNQIFGGGDPAIVAAADKAAKAADTFAALGKDAVTSGKPPRQTDPAAGALLDAVLNTDVLKGKTPGSGDLRPLGDWSLASVKIGNVYVLSGTGITDLSKLAADEKTIAQVDRNTVTYQPEVGRYFDAQLAIGGAVAQAVATDKSANQDAVAQIRAGLSQAMLGMISALAVEGLEPAWRQARAAALEAAAPQFATVLLPDQCMTLHAAAGEVGAMMGDPVLAARLGAFNAALRC